jgi:hypothetical protein
MQILLAANAGVSAAKASAVSKIVGLQTQRLSEIDFKPVSRLLVFACHLGRCMTDLLLHIGFVDFRGVEAGEGD